MTPTQPWELVTPADDGQMVFWPEPARWAELAQRTATDWAADGQASLFDLPLARAREFARASLPTFAEPATESPDGPWICTGHQTFPYHPGVWAKNCAVDALARQLGGRAVNLNVDHDLPHAGPQIAWPAVAPDGRIVRRGEFELDHLQPFERQPAPSPARVSDICGRITADVDPLLTETRTCPIQMRLDGEGADPTSFAGWCSRMRAALDSRIGLRMTEVLTSAMCGGEAFLLFAADLVARAGELAVTYNSALAHATGMTGHRPAVPLQIDAARVELPLWTLRRDRPGRGRLFASPAGRVVRLSDPVGPIGEFEPGATADESIHRIGRVLADAGVQLRPRALTLTLFARLLLADLFVHGIGGARYEAATDRLFDRFYQVPPPPYAVASATLRLPLKFATATAVQLRQARQTLRDIRLNAQRHLPAEMLAQPNVAALVDAKWADVRQDAQLRAERDAGRNVRAQRAAVFAHLHRVNDELTRQAGDLIAQQDARVRQLASRTEAAELSTARDYFYGLFPTARLHRLRDAIGEALSPR